MRGSFGLAAFALQHVSSEAIHRSEVTPIQKAVQLLEGMLVKAKKEKHEEQVQFARFEKFCEGTTADKQDSIKTADEEIEVLKADIEKYEADVERLDGEIEKHYADVDGWEKDEKAASEVRGTERNEYLKTHSDYTETLNALTEAILILKQQAHDTPGASGGASALLQHVRSLNTIPETARKTIDAFLERGDDDIVTAPEANAYEFRSGDIVTMLEGLKDKFREKRRELEKDEMSRRHAFESLSQNLHQSITASQNEIADSTQTVAKRKQQIAESKSTLDDTTKTRTDDAKYLEDLTATCKSKTDDFGARQKLRGEEIVALDKAVEILKSDKVSGNAEKHLPAMLQKHNATSFAQLRGIVDNPDAQLRVAAYLRDQADIIGSRVLSTIAMKVRDDPFGKVKKLIQELIERLMHEATEEAEHKGWCDTELGTNEHTRKTKTAEVERLTAEIEGLESKIETLTKDLVGLSKSIAELNAAVAEATDIRNNETADNQQTIIDAQDGQAAIAEAIKVLQDFYSKAGESTALVQKLRQEPPPIFDEPYQGQQAESGGVLGMLDVIKSDFARLEQDTKSSEEAAQAEYDSFMSDSAVDKAAKETDQGNKEKDKHEAGMTLDETKENLEQSQKQLTAANEYFEKLKPSCIDEGMSYEERVKRRREEIEALKEALRILSGEDIAALNQE